MQKTFKTLEEQIEILESKGLEIIDYEKTKEILFKENYFFINGYRHLLTNPNNNDRFVPGSTFDELYAIFIFDRRLRNIMFKNIMIIENNIKSIISYQMSKKYGHREKDYLNPKHFRYDSFKLSQVNDVINKMKRQIRLNGKQHRATKHYISNYGYIPMWVSVKVLSFGIISELYSILKYEDQNDIANFYHVDPDELNVYLYLLSNYRNLCAHEDILYDHITQRSIPDNRFHQFLNIPKVEDEYVYGKNDFFAVLIILRQMLGDGEFHDLVNEIGYEIDILDGKIDSVDTKSILNKIGFPDNWRELENID